MNLTKRVECNTNEILMLALISRKLKETDREHVYWDGTEFWGLLAIALKTGNYY